MSDLQQTWTVSARSQRTTHDHANTHLPSMLQVTGERAPGAGAGELFRCAGEDEALLVNWNALPVHDLCFDRLDGVRRLHL